MAAITPLLTGGGIDLRRPGRPRHSGRAVSGGGSAREEILDRAARFFTTKGYAATSTRDIAEACGIRQASLYYYFAGKHEVLADLLGMTVRPSSEKIEEIERELLPESLEAALYLLALVDTFTLAQAPHNVAILGRLPDVISAGDGEVYAEFQADRHQLIEAYTNLGHRLAQRNGTAATPAGLGAMLIDLVEGVIQARADGGLIDSERAHEIASGCLRLCGCDQTQIDTARTRAEQLRAELWRESLVETPR
ncbi:MAG: TetR/AcrR family transcriptional regulator [Pseudonocardiaceae bacterium]